MYLSIVNLILSIYFGISLLILIVLCIHDCLIGYTYIPFQMQVHTKLWILKALSLPAAVHSKLPYVYERIGVNVHVSEYMCIVNRCTCEYVCEHASAWSQSPYSVPSCSQKITSPWWLPIFKHCWAKPGAMNTNVVEPAFLFKVTLDVGLWSTIQTWPQAVWIIFVIYHH